MHGEAKLALEKAKKLIESADADSLRYACLELRTAIEHLFYELIPLYKEELPTDIVDKWQPTQIISALVDCDPLVEQDSKLCIFADEQGQPGTPHYLGEQKAVSRKLLQKYYHALGFYLHAPMSGKEHDCARLAKRLEETAAVVEDRCSGRLLSNISQKASYTCICGRKVVRNMRAIEKSPFVACPDSKCGATFEYIDEKDGKCSFVLMVQSWKCEKCQNINEFGSHLLKDGLELACTQCESRVVVRHRYRVTPVEDGEKKAT